VTPPDRPVTPGGAVGPYPGGGEAVDTAEATQATQAGEAVRAVLADLGPPERADVADPDHPTDRLASVAEAHSRLRRLLELPDA